jgi:ATP-dependent Lhr-like helicase
MARKMMNSQPSSSEPGEAHVRARAAALGFERLHPRVRAWVWDQGWDSLRPTQVQAIAPILDGTGDVVISATTASGKTEAAWLPIVSALGFEADSDEAEPGIKALYIGPLRALINDQYSRIEVLGSYLDIPAWRRHGDVGAADRSALLHNPDGILLITPESLEAMFVTQGPQVARVFNGLRYIVVDELHSFIGTERGAQLQSLMHRVELAIRRRVPRVALSATLAEPEGAAEFLRPGHGQAVTIVGDPSDDRVELRLQLRGYLIPARSLKPGRPTPGHGDDVEDESALEGWEEEDDSEDEGLVSKEAIAAHIFRTHRGADNLVFANSRNAVETYADLLQRTSARERVPNEFFPHHGNLSKDHREDVERRLKSPESPATAICTSTLEMGIDIGSVDAIAQVGAPGRVSSLRQRLGRSGRRGQPAVLRMYVSELELGKDASPVDQLRTQTVQTIATVELLLDAWYEPPNMDGLHLSTLVQQILSVIAQHGGATAPELFRTLCIEGPFQRVTQAMFVRLLRDMGAGDLVIQSSDGLLLPGVTGERIINQYSFYTAFQTSEEYRLIADGKTLGSVPVDYPIVIGALLIFAGRRWRVVEIDTRAKAIDLVRSTGGRPPVFIGSGVEIADGVRRKMREVLDGTDRPPYLDRTAQRFLDEARATYRRLQLDRKPVVAWGRDTLIFPWRGDRIMNTLAVMLGTKGITVSQDGVALTCARTSPERLLKAVGELEAAGMPVASALARNVRIKEKDKHDPWIGGELLTEAYAARDLDVAGVWSALRATLATGQDQSPS